MMSQLRTGQACLVTLGFASGANGESVAYARMHGGQKSGAPAALRVAFQCRPSPALQGRDVAYAALSAVAAEALRRGVRRVRFRVADAELPLDLRERRVVPPALVIPYLALRCRLNQFAESTIERGDERELADLTARARADASLHVAA
jgi:hypothetical protein